MTINPVQVLTTETYNASITCTAFGIPVPDISWLNESIAEITPLPGFLTIEHESRVNASGLLVASSTITIHSVRRSDAMKYTCKANNSVPNYIGVPGNVPQNFSSIKVAKLQK